MMRRGLAAFGAAAMLAMSAAGEEKTAQVIPMYSFQMLGGQNFYTGHTASLSGNVGGVAAPAVKFNDRWSLLPTLTSNFTGTRQVLDVVAGGSLFQSQWQNQLTVKGIYSPPGSDWRFKPFAAFKYDLLQETKDEQLGHGLYDYRQWDAGVDAEYVYREPFALRLGADYYETHFPNYRSLESQAATQFQGQSLARELVGDYVLDTHNLLLTASLDERIPRDFILEERASFLYEQFPRQHVVNGAGGLDEGTRADVVSSMGLTLKRPWELAPETKALASLGAGYAFANSNQSSYDASQTRYLPLFYNYAEFKLAPDVKFYFGPSDAPAILSVSGAWWHRDYPHRPIQSASGTYIGPALYTESWMAQGSLSYPMAPHFNLMFSVQYGQETSNQQFLELYQYQYKTATYMFGFSYDY